MIRRLLLCTVPLALVAGLTLSAPSGSADPPLGPKASQPLSAYAKHVLSLGPVGYWRLDEAKGPTALDLSKHKHNGTYHGTIGFHQAGALKGDPDKAIRLEHKSYVQMPASKDFSVNLKHGLTVEAWMRPDQLTFPGQTGKGKDPYVHWLGKGETGQFEWGFRFYSQKRPDGTLSERPNRISAYIWNAAGDEGAGAYFEDHLVKGQWIHVVAVYEPPGKNAGVLIYRDGVLRKGPPSKGTLYSSYNITPTSGTAPLRLGTRDLGSFLIGGLDEVAIYPRMLTAQEIQQNHSLGVKK